MVPWSRQSTLMSLTLFLALVQVTVAPIDPVPAPSPQPSITVYDVRDLTGQGRLDDLARDIVSEAVSTETRIVLLERYRELIEEGAARKSMENIVATVRTLITPPLLDEVHKVQPLGDGTFTLVGSEEQHTWTRAYLAGQRSFEGLLDVRCTVLELPRGRFEALLEGRSSMIMDSASAQSLREQAGATSVLVAPRVLVQPSQRASLATLDQTAYIKDYRLIVVDANNEVIDPVVDVVSTGLELDVLAAPMQAGHLTLWADLRLSSAPRPFREAKVKLGAQGTEVTVQLPEVTTTRIEGRFALPFGHVLALRGVPDSARDEELLLLLEVQHAPKAQ